jgi:hypothetical protein
MEESQADKFGPKSTYTGWIKMGDMDKVQAINTSKDYSPDVDFDVLDKAFSLISEYIKSQSLELLSFDEIMSGSLNGGPVFLESMGLDTSKSSGFPYLAKAFKPNQELSPADNKQAALAYEWIKKRFRLLKPKLIAGQLVPRFKCSVHYRVVSVGPKWKDVKKKTRLVIAPSKDETALGKSYTGPIQRELKQASFLGPRFNMHAGDSGIFPYNAWHDLPFIDIMQQKILHLANKYNTVALSGDISGYDASIIPDLLIRCGVMESNWVKAGRMPEMLAKSLVQGFDLMTPQGIVKGVEGSMKSGSVHTNKYDTEILSAILIYGALHGDYQLLAYEVNGDDFVAVGEGVNPDNIAKLFKHFNLEVHPDKQFYVKDMLSYLQRIHRYGFLGGASSAARVINSATSYERLKVKGSDWSPYVEVVRVLAQLENLAFSPYFEKTIKFVQKHDKLNLAANMSPEDLIKRVEDTGLQVMSEDVVGAWHSNGDPEGFAKWAVNGVLRGEVLPPLGSKRRFKRVYSDRVDQFSNFLTQLVWVPE